MAIVADTLRRFDATMDAQRLAETASSSPTPLNLITLRQADRDAVAPAIGNLPGVVITPQPELLPTDDRFAPDIVNQVKKSVVDELDGKAGWRVVSVNQNGADVDVLNETPGAPAPSVTISLDRAVQNAAHAVGVGLRDEAGDHARDRRDRQIGRTARFNQGGDAAVRLLCPVPLC